MWFRGSYPRFHNDEETFADTMTENAFDHAMIRGLKKDQPFMLMESAPGPVNWHPFNKMKLSGRAPAGFAAGSGDFRFRYRTVFPVAERQRIA